jgi:hypothetical protein
LKRALTSFVLTLYVMMFVSACDNDGNEVAATATSAASLSPTAARTNTAAPHGSATVASTRPGVPPDVDEVIDVILSGNPAALEAFVSLTGLPCGAQQGPGSPPACPPGEPAGTMVEVFPVATCEGELRPQQFVRPTLEMLTSAQPQLAAVYRAPDPYLHRDIDGEYVAVFSRRGFSPSETGLGAGALITDGRVVGLYFGCRVGPDQVVPPGSPAVYLAGN